MFQDTPCICIPFVSNDGFHPTESEVIGLYLYFMDGTTKNINFTHPDSLSSNYSLADIRLHPNSLVLNKKTMLYYGFDDGIDLNSYLHYYIHDHVDIHDFYTNVMENFYSRYYTSKKLSKIIPLSKLIEFAENIILYVLSYYKPEEISQECINYCNDFTNTFKFIESNQIPFGDEMKNQNYMWYTATSRPSNSWNNFNFSALNKNDGTRNKIHSRFENGKIVQFDYDAFHIKLLAKILDYKFTKHPYDEIKEELGLDIPYDEVKSRVFQNIYGTITDQFLQHPFFQRVQAMIDELYQEYIEKGYIESYFYHKRFREIEDPTPNKVFNYFLQSLETEYNVRKLKTVLPMLQDQRTVLCMYLYDAFVFDVPSDEIEFIPHLKRSFETDEMTTKCSIGGDFGSIKPYLYVSNNQ
jgi:hypothetical protein